MNIPDTFSGPGIPSAVPGPPAADPLLITDVEHSRVEDPSVALSESLGTAAKLLAKIVLGDITKQRANIEKLAGILVDSGLREEDVLDLFNNARRGEDGAQLRLVQRIEAALRAAHAAMTGGQG